jgi:hypothetical protein
MVTSHFNSRGWYVSVFLAGCLWAERAHAQVSVQSATVEGMTFSAPAFLRTTLLNAGSACQVMLEGEVRARAGAPVLTFQTDRLLLHGGATTLNAGQLTMRSFVLSTSEVGRTVQRYQRLPEGAYTYCVRVVASGSEVQDEYCDVLEMEEFLFLDLVQPWNGDTIDEIRPALTWSISGSAVPLSTADIRLVLAPMTGERKAAQALASERPLFMLPHVQERTVPYPAGVSDLERGKCYAWQAERLVEGRVVDRSEPWSFCVRDRVAPAPDKYVHLDRLAPGTIIKVVDDRIFFRYDEPYASERIDCRIIGGSGERIVPKVRDDASRNAAPDVRSVGENLYELDLSVYGLKPGYYDLVVKNEKGRERTLKFQVGL